MDDNREIAAMFDVSDGVVSIELSLEEMQLLSQLAVVPSTVGVDATDPGYEILHRPVYPDDAASNAELNALVTEEVDRQRIADRLIVKDLAAGRTSMTEEEAHGFLRSVNEVRLVLAARAGAFDEGADWEEGISQNPTLAVVAWLGYLQGELIERLSHL